MASASGPMIGSIRTVVVGVDGSPSAARALDWAADLVGADGVLHAVHAVSPSTELAVAAVQLDSRRMVAERRGELEGVWTAAVRGNVGSVVDHVLESEPAEAVQKVAAQVTADMIAVGAHRRAAHGPHRIGRTVSNLVDHARIPLAVIPEGTHPTRTGTVVIGVGTGSEIRPAMRFARDYALAHGRSLSLVRTGEAPPVFSMEWMVSRMGQFLDPGVLKSWAVEDLADLGREIQRSTDEELQVSWSAPGRRAGPRLVDASTDAALLVLDARPDSGSPVPSWVHHAIRHAPCPVVLFPPPETQADSA